MASLAFHAAFALDRASFYVCYHCPDQPATCLLEVLVHAGQVQAAYDLVPVSVRLGRAVDLASAAGRKRAGVSLAALVMPPTVVRNARKDIVGAKYEETWDLGTRAFAEGADGLVVPSAAIRGQEVLVLFERARPAGRVRVHAARKLSIDPRMRD